MHALVWDGQHLRLDTAYATPQVDAATALVRVHLAGICATDLQIFQGYMGFQGIPGHEFVGQVSAGPAALLGQRVVGEINFACGRCTVCAQGLGRHCPTRRVMEILHADGSFAEYVSVPVTNLHPVPDSVTDVLTWATAVQAGGALLNRPCDSVRADGGQPGETLQGQSQAGDVQPQVDDLVRVLEGRAYYLLEDNFTCRAHAPERPRIKSWKNKLEFTRGQVLLWHTPDIPWTGQGYTSRADRDRASHHRSDKGACHGVQGWQTPLYDRGQNPLRAYCP